jgi:hypothetical protein
MIQHSLFLIEDFDLTLSCLRSRFVTRDRAILFSYSVWGNVKLTTATPKFPCCQKSSALVLYLELKSKDQSHLSARHMFHLPVCSVLWADNTFVPDSHQWTVVDMVGGCDKSTA